MTSRNPRRRQTIFVGSKIRQLRKDRQLTQCELASRIGVQQSDLCRMETGEYKVSLDTLFKILMIFQMDIGEFFRDESPAPLSSDEREIVSLLRQLDDSSRIEFREFLRFRVGGGGRD